MRLFTKVRAVVLGLAVLAGTLGGSVALNAVAAPPAAAGDWYWTNTACWSSPPINGRWYGQPPNGGARYESVWGNFLIGGNDSFGAGHSLHAWFRDLGYECGWAGFPITDVVVQHIDPYPSLTNYYVQYFINPADICTMRWLWTRSIDGVRGVDYRLHTFC